MLLGAHVSRAGKVYQAVERAADLGINTMQMFSRSPQGWGNKEISEEDCTEFRSKAKKHKIAPVFIHIPYLVNLATPENKLFHSSITTYTDDILIAAELGAEYVVTHMGSHKESGEPLGLARLSQGINKALAATAESGVTLLLENTSGAGNLLGYKFAHMAEVIKSCAQKKRLGICLDTCHAYSAGYDIATVKGLEAALDEMDSCVGLARLKLIHLNDTRDEFNSHKDRHEHIGKGKIGLEGFRRIVNHLALKGLPFILETPENEQGDDKMNLETVLRLREE